jgi:ribonuclease Z
MPLTTTPVIGTPVGPYAEVLEPGAESIRPDEIRVTILGSGDPFVKNGQAAAPLLIEVGNAEQDFFFLDLGSGALANFNGLGLPVTATTKVFLSHLHADHVGDMPTLVWSLAKASRRDPVEVWGRPVSTSGSAPRPLPATWRWRTRGTCSRCPVTPVSPAPE